MAISISFHLLAAIIWVGGMFFAIMFLRPAAASQLQPQQRFPLWESVLSRFFRWVWVAVVTILLTGLAMIFTLGGMGNVGLHVHLMLLLGILMMLLFLHVYFNPFKKLKWAVAEHDWITAANELGKIRKYVQFNLIIGLIVATLGVAGRYF